MYYLEQDNEYAVHWAGKIHAWTTDKSKARPIKTLEYAIRLAKQAAQKPDYHVMDITEAATGRVVQEFGANKIQHLGRLNKNYRTIERDKLSTLHCGPNPQPLIIDNNIIKRYVGIGWIDERPATLEDYASIPEAFGRIWKSKQDAFGA